MDLVHIALVISIFGLLMLTYASEHLEPPLSRIDQVTSNTLGKNVRIHGNISEIHEFEGGSILISLQDPTGEIDVYLPYNVAASYKDMLNATELETELEVIGSVEVYKGKLEIVIENMGGIGV